MFIMRRVHGSRNPIFATIDSGHPKPKMLRDIRSAISVWEGFVPPETSSAFFDCSKTVTGVAMSKAGTNVLGKRPCDCVNACFGHDLELALCLLLLAESQMER